MNINVFLMLKARAASFKKIELDAQYSNGKASAQAKRLSATLVATQRQLLDNALVTGGWYKGERRDQVTAYFDLAVSAINGKVITGEQLIEARNASAVATNASMGYSMSAQSDEQIQTPFNLIDSFVAEALSNRLIKKLPKPKADESQPT